MPKKRIFIKIVLPIGFVAVVLCIWVLDYVIKHRHEYHCGAYTQSEVENMFSEYHDLFMQLPRILETEAFWEKGRVADGEAHAYLWYPDDENLTLFSKSDQQILVDFFDKTKPYMISLDYQEHLRVDFINEDRTSSYTIFYVYYNSLGHRYPLTAPTGNIVRWVHEHNYEYKDLKDCWGMYYRKKS